MASTPPGERGLVRKTSKSRLAKQAEVEDEEVKIPETRVESFDQLEEDVGGEGSPVLRSKFLIRSHALCGDDDTKLKARSLEKQGSSKSGSAGSSLSRDSSTELYTDSTGIDLEAFIRSTLHKNAKDRQMILQLEQELIKFVQDTNKPAHKFPPMSSYNRMLVHRISAFFGVDHNVDQSGTAVVVNKTPNSRIPDVPFSEYIEGDFYAEEPKRLLRRDVQSCEEVRGGEGMPDIRKAKSFEEREEDYERARAKIFSQQDSSSSAEIIESPLRNFSGYSSDSMQAHSSSMTGDVARPWSSTDSGSLDVPNLPVRGPIATMQKAGSFGGVPSVCHHKEVGRNPPQRSNTDASKAADMSPGSLARHRQVQPCPIPEGMVIGQPGVPGAPMGPGQQVIFAVSSWDQVPPGAMIFSPQTGQPYLNPDGSMYRHMRQYAASPTPPAPYMQAPFIQTDPSILCGGMQSMTLQPPLAGSAPSPAGSFQSGQQMMTYVMPGSGSGSEGSGTPPPASAQPLVLQMQSPYAMPGPVQYQSSVQYVMPSPQVVYESGTTPPSSGGSGYGVGVQYPQQMVVMMQRPDITTSRQSAQVPSDQATSNTDSEIKESLEEASGEGVAR